MSPPRRSSYQRLLRWYPPSWRRANGQVMLDTLEQHASATGHAKPSAGEAWSIRAHGLAEQATPPRIVGISAAALLLSLVPTAALWFGAPLNGPGLMSAQFFASLLTSIGAGALLLRAGMLRAEPALFAGIVAIPAWVFGGLAAASWSVGFDEADAGDGLSWFGSATGEFMLAGWVLGTVALTPIAFEIFRVIRSRTVRRTVSVLVAGPTALALGVGALLLQGTILASVGVLIAATVHLRSPQTPALTQRLGRATLSSTARKSLAVATSGAAILGIGCVVFALTGSTWPRITLDATETMRLGILSGALVAIITVVSSAIAVHPRMGRTAIWVAAVLVVALIVLAASYAGNIDSPLGWTWLLIAATLTGLAGALLLAPVLPGTPLMRGGLIAAISVALAATLGLMVITIAAFIAPVIAVAVTVILWRRPRQRAPVTPFVHAA
jgi:hypothetical protein